MRFILNIFCLLLIIGCASSSLKKEGSSFRNPSSKRELAQEKGTCLQGEYKVKIYEGLAAKYRFRFEDTMDGKAVLKSELINPEEKVSLDGQTMALKDSYFNRPEIQFTRRDSVQGAKCDCGQYDGQGENVSAWIEYGSLNMLKQGWESYWIVTKQEVCSPE